jgi:FkbM family methyltransferase
MTWWKNEFYSQFGEDAVLCGYFKSREYSRSRRIDSVGSGFFVDVGAHHPFMISNTWYFYQHGWRGINIEPTPGAKEEFDKHRPEDINLNCAVSRKNGTSKLVSYGRDVKNTLEISEIDHSRSPKVIKIKTRTLASVLDEYLPKETQIDFLSVDVEGHDLVAIKSNNWDRYRPEIVVVEERANSIEALLDGEVFKTMLAFGYVLHAWVRPSLIFRRRVL